MQRTDFERDFLAAFKDSTIGNYVVPGLESEAAFEVIQAFAKRVKEYDKNATIDATIRK